MMKKRMEVERRGVDEGRELLEGNKKTENAC